MDLEDTAKILSAISAIVVFFCASFRHVCRFSKKVFRGMRDVISGPSNVAHRLVDIDQKLEEIWSELCYEDGSTIKDILLDTRDAVNMNVSRFGFADDVSETAIYECDISSGALTRANVALCELFGLSSEQMLGRGWLRAIAPDDRETCWNHYQAAIESCLPYDWVYTVENVRTKKRYRCKTSMWTLLGNDGKPMLYKGIVRPMEEL